MRTFAEHLQQFTHAVDIVSDETFESVRLLVTQYLRSVLSIDYFEMMLEAKVNAKPGLETFWTTGQHFSNELYSPTGEFQGKTAYAFKECVELWIVADGKDNLLTASKYVDCWSKRGGPQSTTV